MILFPLEFGRLNAHTIWQGLLFQQDGATCYTSRDSVVRVREVFTEERTACKGLWLPRSLDLSTRVLFFIFVGAWRAKLTNQILTL